MFTGRFTQYFSAILILAQLIAWLFGIPFMPYGAQLDWSKFEESPVWADEFDGDSLDRTKWKDHHSSEGTTIRRGGYWNLKMVEVQDGFLNINTAYLEEGLDGQGAGYYSAGIDTNGLFAQAHGYFEVRCKLPMGAGHWAAFWMLNDTMWNVDGSGADGAEIDVFEAPYYNKPGPFYSKSICSNVHIDGYGEGHQSKSVSRTVVPGDPYAEFHTYGLEWNEEEYIFYVDGVRCGKTDFGVSQTPEYLILSVEVGGENAVPADSWSGDIRNNEFLPTSFVVDYVRVYAYK